MSDSSSSHTSLVEVSSTVPEIDPRPLLELKEVTDRMGPLPQPKLVVTLQSHQCESCKGEFSEPEFFWHWTGVVRAMDLLCPKCAQQALKDTCQLVCLTCCTLVTRMQKLKTESGFLFEAGKYYHTKDCPHCLKESDLPPGTQRRAEIIELELYKQHHGTTH